MPTSTIKSRKRVLVSGGAGFVGSHLCDRLLADGSTVVCVDNMSTGREQNLADALRHSRFRFIAHDITRPIHLDVDGIYNLACPASPAHYQLDPIRTLETCVFGSINMLGLAKRREVKILQASASEVYGDPEMHPQREIYWGHVNPIGIRACYDEGKRAAETLFFDYHRRHGVRIKVCRIFNTYGPRMNPEDGRVVSNFIVQALTGEAITMFGDGTQTRTFCYVDDLVEGLIRVMDSGDYFVGPVNLGSSAEFTIAQLADTILSLTGSKSKIVRRPLPADDPTKRRPDLSSAREALSWYPRVPLPEGLLRTIEYFDELLRRPRIALNAEATTSVYL